jgi:glycosyltransferase involved in cell wall biosynthesis
MKGQVALVLKVSGAGFSLLDLEEIKDKINKIKDNLPDREMQPNVYIVHGDLTDSEMNELYNINKIKAMVTCTHGEGYGRPLAEFAAATGKPVLATG